MGEPCILKTDMKNPIVQGNSKVILTKMGENTYRIALKKGQTITLTPQKSRLDAAIQPISFKNKTFNYFGLK